MYNTNQKTKYYIYDLYTNTYVKQFESEEDLIKFLVRTTNESEWWRKDKYHNDYLDSIAMNVNDTYYKVNYKDLSSIKANRRYIFIDPYGRILDARKYWVTIKERYNENHYPDRRVAEDAKHGDKYYCYIWRGCGLYSFRNGPVPGIHKLRSYGYFRSLRTARELRDNCNDIYKDYVRGRRKNLPTLYDDLVRTKSRSWKDCAKKRKQWM